MRDLRLKDRAWRERVGFDNVKTIEDLIREMPAARRTPPPVSGIGESAGGVAPSRPSHEGRTQQILLGGTAPAKVHDELVARAVALRKEIADWSQK
jgi:hypothetical protein